MVEKPPDFAARKVSVDDQAGLAADQIGMTSALQFVAETRRSAILPDDRIVNRRAGTAVPDHGRLPLVGDTDGSDIFGFQAGLGQGCTGNFELAGPNLTWVMLDPSGLWEDLFEFLLGHPAHRAAVVEQNRPRTGRTLIQSQNDGHNCMN